MIAMQYQIILPKDYNMGIIKKRVRDNGHKTDGFPGLHFKAYLITEAEKNGNLYNSYAPLYVWNSTEGMNHFIFEGYYDNILTSFGWQHINIGVPLSMDLDKEFNNSSYVVEYTGKIPESKSLTKTTFNTIDTYVKNADRNVGSILIYNPDKWGYSQFSFYQEKPEIITFENVTVYQILHVSRS